MQDDVYTLGTWIVKPGFEAQFKQAWSDFAELTRASFPGAVSAVLLQDTMNPRRFISVGPWRSEQDIAAWRASDAFAQAIAQITPMLESFEPASFWPVYKVE